MSLVIYTDGSCLKNPGPGGFAFIIIFENYELHFADSVNHTTNNRMELTAVIEALKYCTETKITFFTDSKYVINCALNKWKKNKNNDLWNAYTFLAKNFDISFTWIKGHSGNYYNELVDKMANTQAKSLLL
jgi:ribonuclease HI